MIGPSLWTSGLPFFGLLSSSTQTFGSKHHLSTTRSLTKPREEFVKWVFAEDKDISEGVTGKFTLEISGCSRPELNGKLCAANRVLLSTAYLPLPRKGALSFLPWEKASRHQGLVWVTPNHRQPFSKLRQQWQIFSRTGTYASARLKTSRAAHMPGDGTMWAVWRTGASHFVFRLDNFNPSLEARNKKKPVLFVLRTLQICMPVLRFISFHSSGDCLISWPKLR